MKAKLTFDLTDSDQAAEFRRAINGNGAYAALWDIAQEIFRPARKHGYQEQELRDLMEATPKAEDLVAALEAKFYRILEEQGVDLSKDWT